MVVCFVHSLIFVEKSNSRIVSQDFFELVRQWNRIHRTFLTLTPLVGRMAWDVPVSQLLFFIVLRQESFAVVFLQRSDIVKRFGDSQQLSLIIDVLKEAVVEEPRALVQMAWDPSILQRLSAQTSKKQLVASLHIVRGCTFKVKYVSKGRICVRISKISKKQVKGFQIRLPSVRDVLIQTMGGSWPRRNCRVQI